MSPSGVRWDKRRNPGQGKASMPAGAIHAVCQHSLDMVKLLHCIWKFTCSLNQMKRYNLPTPDVTQPSHAFKVSRGPYHV